MTRNYRCRWGEIDLIVQDNSVLVFVEVRYRKKSDFSDALGSVSRHKQAKLIQCARHYLSHVENNLNTLCRFDVIAFDASQAATKNTQARNAQSCDLTWVKNAFDLSQADV